MARHFVSIPRDYLSKWSAFKRYLQERPDVVGYGLVDDVNICGVMLCSLERIHYIFVPTESRRGGYARELVNYAINKVCANVPRLSVAIGMDEQPALALFLSTGFKIVGFNYGDSGKRAYALDYLPAPIRNNELQVLHDSLAIDTVDILEKLLVVETLPVRL